MNIKNIYLCLLLAVSLSFSQNISLNKKYEYTEFDKSNTTFLKIIHHQITFTGNPEAENFDDESTKLSIADSHNEMIANKGFFQIINSLDAEEGDFFQKSYQFRNEKEMRDIVIKVREPSNEHVYKTFPKTKYLLLTDQMTFNFKDSVLELSLSFVLNDFIENTTVITGIATAKLPKTKNDFTFNDINSLHEKLIADLYAKINSNKRNKKYFSASIGFYSATASFNAELAITPIPYFSIIGNVGYGIFGKVMWQGGLAYNIIPPGDLNKFRLAVYATYGRSTIIRHKPKYTNYDPAEDNILWDTYYKVYNGVNLGASGGILFGEKRTHGIQLKINFIVTSGDYKDDIKMIGNYANVDVVDKPKNIPFGAGLYYLVEF